MPALDCNRSHRSNIMLVAAMRWVLLSSRLPREPSRLRLAVWRRGLRLERRRDYFHEGPTQ